MNIALKEWSSVIEAAARGWQLFLLRKGGIAEAGRGFRLRASEFLLFPTFEHQHRRWVRPQFHELVREPEPEVVRIAYAGRVAGAWEAPASPDPMLAASRHYIWTEEFIRQRYAYRPELPLWLILVRIYRLNHEHRLPQRPSYAGCKSWVHLTEELDASDAVPVLSDSRFEEARSLLMRDLRLAADRVSTSS